MYETIPAGNRVPIAYHQVHSSANCVSWDTTVDMVDITTSTKRQNGVTLVHATVTNTRATTQTVSVRSQVDGPTWLPRHDGIPASEWTDETWTAVLKPGETRGLGFATPAEPTDSPAEIVSVSRSQENERNNEDIISSLEDWSPPNTISTEKQ